MTAALIVLFYGLVATIGAVSAALMIKAMKL